jgi:hypothetical protein
MRRTLEAMQVAVAPPPAVALGPALRTPSDVFYTLRMRNHTMDALFYDVCVLSMAEIEALHALLGAEGGVLIVTPEAGDPIRFLPTPEEFLAMPERPRALAVAGVGSSAIGTAAFARNVALALGKPVAGVVSGYGMRDMMAEAMGGWFWFRARNLLFHDRSAAARAALVTGDGLSVLRDAYSPDTVALTGLFQANEPAFDIIAAHSKGNLSVAEALYLSLDAAPAAAKRLMRGAHIITMGAAIYMPDQCRRVTDILGSGDWFGRMNSHPEIDIDIVVDGALHHTNTDIPACLDVVEAIRQAVTLH